MHRILILALFFLGIFLQAGTYGLTFLLPKLFSEFGANEIAVGRMLLITTVVTLLSVYFSGHLSDKLGRVNALGLSGFSIAAALWLFATSDNTGIQLIVASALLGFGWGVYYTLGPVVLTRITQPAQRVRYFSIMSVFIMAGFGLSPVMASMFENAGLSVAFSFKLMSVVCLISGLIFFILSRPIRSLALDQSPESKSGLELKVLRQIFQSRGLVPIIMVCIGASVFAGMNNFQTVFAENRNLQYADFFLAYTITVIVCRLLTAGFNGGKSPYAIIALLQYVMAASIFLFLLMPNTTPMYVLVAILFGIGYGASYPILAAMAANDADHDIVPQTLQVFALTYFIGIFGFPMIAGWIIVKVEVSYLLILIGVMAIIEATMALFRYIEHKKLEVDSKDIATT